MNQIKISMILVLLMIMDNLRIINMIKILKFYIKNNLNHLNNFKKKLYEYHILSYTIYYIFILILISIEFS